MWNVSSNQSVKFLKFTGLLGFLVFFSACQKNASLSLTSNLSTKAATASCESIEGTPWVPNISGANAGSAHSELLQITNTELTGSANAIGVAQGYGSGQIVELQFTVSEDIGGTNDFGSISLVAQVDQPASELALRGVSIQPALISLSNGIVDLVNLSSSCTNSGFYSCTNGSCSLNTDCSPTAPSMFLGDYSITRRLQWEFKQGIGYDAPSVVTFPSCDGNETGTLACPFAGNSANFLTSGRLTKGTYTAKYVLVANTASTLENTSKYASQLKLNVIKKVDTKLGSSHQGSFDLNVILVGTQNIKDSRTEKGKQNLDALFQHVYNHYYSDNTSSTGVKLGKINVHEWSCEEGGDAYATIPEEKTHLLFKNGSKVLPVETNGSSVNIFLVSRIPYSGSGTILGKSGGIPGAMIHGTGSSGAVFSSFDSLADFNPSCNTGGSCPVSAQESDFIEMGSTISHEIGHYFGLNHPSEADAAFHDTLLDTPECTVTVGGMVSISSCLSALNSAHPVTGQKCSSQCGSYSSLNSQFCPSVQECQFNHVMWWTTKNHGTNGTGDGNLFSDYSGAIINRSPIVR